MSLPPPPGELTSAELQHAVATLAELCAISSSSGDDAGLERAAAWLDDAFTARGFACSVERAESDRRLPLFVARAPTAGRRPLLLLGHFDTVLDAAPPRRAPEALHATGAIDMKGGIAALLAALDHLARRGAPEPEDLLLVLVPDEEVGGAISSRATVRFGAEARGCFVLEPGERRGPDVETIVAGRRGLTDFRLTAHGRAAHSGLAFWEGRSAVAATARWCVEAAALSRPGGPTVNLARLVGGDAAFVEALAEHAELAGSDRQLNVVADRASVEGEFRFLSPADGAAVRERLLELAREVAASTEVRLELRFGFEAAPVDATPARLAVARRAVEFAARRGWTLEVERDRGGISFPNFLPPELELPVLDGLGPAGGGMHTREEFVDLRSFARRVVLLADLLEGERTGS